MLGADLFRSCDVIDLSLWHPGICLRKKENGRDGLKVNVGSTQLCEGKDGIFVMEWIKRNLVWVMLGGVVCLFLLNFSMVFFVSSENTRGTFGDQFGAVNALFSGLAFAGLIYTIILQRRDLELQRHDLKLQRKELELTRKEMEEQTVEFEKQNEILKIQRFENLFYNMLNLQQELTRDLVIEYNGTGEDTIVKKGREVFPYFYEEMKVRYHYKNGSEVTTFKHILSIDEDYKKKLVAVRQLWFMDHYMRHLYRIFRFINDANEISDVKKREYAEIVRATLSPYELVFLYYIGFSHPRFKVLIEKYALLNNLRPFLLAAPDERQLVARKFQTGYTYEMDKDIDETSEYRKTAFHQKDGMDVGDLLTR